MTKSNSKDNKINKYNNNNNNNNTKLDILGKIDKQSKVGKSYNTRGKKKNNKFISECKKNINKFCKTTCKKINNLNCSHIFFDGSDSDNNSDSGNNSDIRNNSVISNNIDNNCGISNNIDNNSGINNNLDNSQSNNCFYKKKKRKQKIPVAVKQNVWVTNFGEVYKHKCYVDWCHRIMSVFEFEVGHNIPESKGGTLDLDNLRPICHQCNIGMGNQYTIDEWSDQKFLDK